MKVTNCLLILFTSLLYTTSAFGAEILPPDSTTSLVDKTAALYIIEEGRALYNEGKTRDALIKFRQASVKDPNSWKAAYWVGKCHYILHNYGYAKKYADQAELLGKDKVTDELYFLLAETYHRLGSLDTAIANYEIALERLPKNRIKELRIAEKLEEAKYAKEAIAAGVEYEKKRLPGAINSGFHDYSIIPTSDPNKVYFTSRRSSTTGGGMNPDDQQYFEDIYRAVYDPDYKAWDSITNELGRINSNGFDALNYLYEDESWGVITLNNTADADVKKPTRSSDLCEIKKNNKGDWNTPKPIKNNSINTSFYEGAATLTADGNTMFFVSDRTGAKSSTDLFMVKRDGKSWGTAVHLPMNVNSVARETTPYVTPDGKYLFFSSDGHKGMGGYDIYVTENLGGNEWSDPINLGAGINSVNNDTHFVYLQDQNKAYISGLEIIGSKASLDIYEIDLTGFEIPKSK